jgi:hypothetical protein
LAAAASDRDLLHLEEPADLRHARLHDVRCAVRDELSEPEHGRVVLAGRDRDAQRGPHAREARVVFRRPDGSSSHRRSKRSSRRPIRIASSTDQGQFVSSMSSTSSPADLARHGDRLDVGLMELDRVVAERERARDRLPTWLGVS